MDSAVFFSFSISFSFCVSFIGIREWIRSYLKESFPLFCFDYKFNVQKCFYYFIITTKSAPCLQRDESQNVNKFERHSSNRQTSRTTWNRNYIKTKWMYEKNRAKWIIPNKTQEGWKKSSFSFRAATEMTINLLFLCFKFFLFLRSLLLFFFIVFVLHLQGLPNFYKTLVPLSLPILFKHAVAILAATHPKQTIKKRECNFKYGGRMRKEQRVNLLFICRLFA